MSGPDIPLDKAELLSVVLEALLYGFSLLMFAATIWTLLLQRQVNRKMLVVACALLICSTAHIVIDVIRIMEGLILDGDARSRDPKKYFSDASQWTFVAKNSVYVTHTLIGDGVVLYRCYIVWQSKLVMILPALLWCATATIGYLCCYILSTVGRSGVFEKTLWPWITSFWATALSTNFLATLLLVCRVWYIDRSTTKLFSHRQSHLRPILHILVDAGVIYSVTLLVQLICFVSQTNGQYVVLDMVTQIISITFYMVILRVGMASRARHPATIPLGNVSTLSEDRRRRMQVRITTLTESKFDCSQQSLTDPDPKSPSGRKVAGETANLATETSTYDAHKERAVAGIGNRRAYSLDSYCFVTSCEGF